MPKTADEASAFLRNQCDLVIYCKPDRDIIRAVLKGHDSADGAIKFQYSRDVDTGDPEAYEESYLDVAQTLWKQWFDCWSSKL